MPHECTDCGAVYEDGSTQMLDGCDGCGGTTFIFTKGAPSADAGAAAGEDAPAETDTAPDVGSGSTGPAEDEAQTTARSGIIEADEVEDGDGAPADEDGAATGAASAEGSTAATTDDPSASSGDSTDGELPTPDADEVREELMAQFESIKIVEPGSYELNLMNLYDRDEKIIALQEDGRYQVSLPSAIED